MKERKEKERKKMNNELEKLWKAAGLKKKSTKNAVRRPKFSDTPITGYTNKNSAVIVTSKLIIFIAGPNRYEESLQNQ